jgi:uncharacterized membrane protein
MYSSTRWYLVQLTRRVWFRAALFSILAIATALVAIAVKPYIPESVPAFIGADATDNILTIIASSMLTVTTFSLSTMVAAYSAATSNVTPRASRLLIEDRSTHNVLATFIGSFLFSLVGIIILSTGLYGDQGRVVIFIVTIAVIVLIVVTLLRWIDHLSRLGRVNETTDRVEDVAASALGDRMKRPYLGGQPFAGEVKVPTSAAAIFTNTIGYVQHVDMGALSDVAGEDGTLYVAALPGAFIDPARPLAYAQDVDLEQRRDAILGAFTIGDERSFDQDPRFGLAVLAEIASRALSPAVNDPGTAIDVLGRGVRLLALWNPDDAPEESREVLFPKVYVPPVLLADLFDDLFDPIGRDGASLFEVQIRLQKALRSLSRIGDETFLRAAHVHSQRALELAKGGLKLESQRHAVEAVAKEIDETARVVLNEPARRNRRRRPAPRARSVKKA